MEHDQEPHLSVIQRGARLLLVFLAGIASLAIWAVSTLWGVLCLAFVALLYVRSHEENVASVDELLQWVLALDPEVLMAALGLIAAYAVAVSTWRQQKRVELQLSATAEIVMFLQRASALALQLDLYADRLSELHRKIDGEQVTAKGLQFDATYLHAQVPTIVSARAELSQMSVDIHALRAKHEMVISNSVLTSKVFDSAVASLDAVVSSMWFGLPLFANDGESFLRALALQDPGDFSSFANAVDVHRARIDAAAGALMGYAHGKVFPLTFASVIRLWKTSAYFIGRKPA